MALLLCLLLITLCTVHALDEYHVIQMERRDVPNAILDELKSQGLGGRMRFGKRSGGQPSSQWGRQFYNRPC